MSVETIPSKIRTLERSELTVQEVLTKGVDNLIPDSESLARKMHGEKIRIYLGIDPTGTDLHLGHLVPLIKLRQFQNLGHEAILVLGTFTARVGDPTDKTAVRKKLTSEEIRKNMVTYQQQLTKIFGSLRDVSNPLILFQNDEWLSKITLEQFLDLASNFTVQQIGNRKMFKERAAVNKPIWLHEYLYTLMQGYDSYHLQVDAEIGGKDQIHNMEVGRHFVKRYLGKEKWNVATKLLEDPSGKKMGKTEGNNVNLNDWPEIKFEMIMSWPDEMIPTAFELLTSVPSQLVEQVRQELSKGTTNPMEVKKSLAFKIIAEIDGVQVAAQAEVEFDRVLREGLPPSRVREYKTQKGVSLSNLLMGSKLVSSEVEANTKIAQGSVLIDGKRAKASVLITEDCIVQIGKRTIKNIRAIRID